MLMAAEKSSIAEQTTGRVMSVKERKRVRDRRTQQNIRDRRAAYINELKSRLKLCTTNHDRKIARLRAENLKFRRTVDEISKLVTGNDPKQSFNASSGISSRNMIIPNLDAAQPLLSVRNIIAIQPSSKPDPGLQEDLDNAPGQTRGMSGSRDLQPRALGGILTQAVETDASRGDVNLVNVWLIDETLDPGD
ncbi:hypothetical protein MMC08_000589 [Hypocenomyce scalaris]|nr:hypothetical protein [Hypocenomyce scalaris]